MLRRFAHILNILNTAQGCQTEQEARSLPFMNAAAVHAFDAPPRYTSFAKPVAADGEVLVDVIAAGLHPIVKALANGSHYGSTRHRLSFPALIG
jgi:hypothetical protein